MEYQKPLSNFMAKGLFAVFAVISNRKNDTFFLKFITKQDHTTCAILSVFDSISLTCARYNNQTPHIFSHFGHAFYQVYGLVQCCRCRCSILQIFFVSVHNIKYAFHTKRKKDILILPCM